MIKINSTSIPGYFNNQTFIEEYWSKLLSVPAMTRIRESININTKTKEMAQKAALGALGIFTTVGALYFGYKQLKTNSVISIHPLDKGIDPVPENNYAVITISLGIAIFSVIKMRSNAQPVKESTKKPTKEKLVEEITDKYIRAGVKEAAREWFSGVISELKEDSIVEWLNKEIAEEQILKVNSTFEKRMAENARKAKEQQLKDDLENRQKNAKTLIEDSSAIKDDVEQEKLSKLQQIYKDQDKLASAYFDQHLSQNWGEQLATYDLSYIVYLKKLWSNVAKSNPWYGFFKDNPQFFDNYIERYWDFRLKKIKDVKNTEIVPDRQLNSELDIIIENDAQTQKYLTS